MNFSQDSDEEDESFDPSVDLPPINNDPIDSSDDQNSEMEKMEEEYLSRVFLEAQESTAEEDRQEEEKESQYSAALDFVLKKNKNISESKAEELARKLLEKQKKLQVRDLKKVCLHIYM